MYPQILFSLLAGKVLSYGLCNANEYRFAGRKVSAPIQGTSTKSIVRNGQTRLVTVGGTVNVVDGCRFETKDIVLDGPLRVQFYGAQGEADPNAVLLTTEELRIPARDKIYSFIQTAGNWVNYDDFTQINLFDPDSQSVVGVAVLREGGVVNVSETTDEVFQEPQDTPGNQLADQTRTNGALKKAFTSAVIMSMIMTFFF